MRAAATGRLFIALAAILAGTVGCGDVNTALQHQSEARHLAANLLVQFTKAADASNRAVMANTDAVAIAAAREADQAKQTVQKDVDALGPILAELGYTDETAQLRSFVGRFSEYSELDRRILDLVVEQTNLKAQQMAFGPAMEAADAFRAALDAVAPSPTAADGWHVKTLAVTAVAAIREIQAVQAPHIADPADTSMDVMETRMAAAEATARRSLDALTPLVSPASRPNLARARAALDRFLTRNVEIVALSRQNTNVRALALSLDQKQKLVAPCEESLRALRDALARRGYPPGR